MRRYKFLLTLWLISDFILFIKVYALAYFLRVGFIFSTDFPFGRYMAVVTISAPLWVLLLVVTRTFSITRKQNSVRNLAYISYASFTAAAIFSITYYFIYGLFFSRLLIVSAILLSIFSGYIWHIIYSLFFRSIVRKNPPSFPTLILGITRESEKLIELLNTQKNPLKPVAILDSKGSRETEIRGVPVIGKLNKMEETIEKFKITHLIQCSDLEQSINLLSACRSLGITYMLLPSVLGIVEKDERVESLEGKSVVCVNKNSKWSWFFK